VFLVEPKNLARLEPDCVRESEISSIMANSDEVAMMDKAHTDEARRRKTYRHASAIKASPLSEALASAAALNRLDTDASYTKEV
jgi:hypothetical protein